MSSIFRKVASAFVVMEPSAVAQPTAPAKPSAPQARSSALHNLSDDADALLAQLEGRSGAGPRPSAPASAQAPAAAAGTSVANIFDAGAAEVFRAANLNDEANSATRLLKIIAGLQMFPREHQVLMIQAMDAADDTWSQGEVIADARRRHALLKQHLDQLAAKRKDELAVLQATIVARTQQGNDALAAIDRKIAELHAQREQSATATASELNLLQQEALSVESRETQARKGIEEVMATLNSLVDLLDPNAAKANAGTSRS
jgi:hypothetical protein